MKTLKEKRVPLMMEPEMVEQIDSFRFAHRIGTRAEAIRSLIKTALETKTATEQGCSPS